MQISETMAIIHKMTFVQGWPFAQGWLYLGKDDSLCKRCKPWSDVFWGNCCVPLLIAKVIFLYKLGINWLRLFDYVFFKCIIGLFPKGAWSTDNAKVLLFVNTKLLFYFIFSYMNGMDGNKYIKHNYLVLSFWQACAI